MDIFKKIAEELNIKPTQVASTVELLDAGNTIPFIARYRKEVTGSLDDTVLRQLEVRLKALRSLLKRKEEVISSLTTLEKLTPELQAAIAKSQTLTELEDIYRPYRPKRRTRASIAKERGLEPLALKILEQKTDELPQSMAENFINPENDITTAEDALAGANDIIAEIISDNADIRRRLREFLWQNGFIVTVLATKEEDHTYQIYHEYNEEIRKLPSHRILAIDRGERENVLKVQVKAEKNDLAAILYEKTIIKNAPDALRTFVAAAADDALDRLIFPSVEREIRAQLTENAAEQAIDVFALNLKPLLLAPPIKEKTVLGYDPGFRTGCKLAVVDYTGKLLDTAVIYPTAPQNDIKGAGKKVLELIQKHGIDLVAIGNGTASKESEIFISDLIKENNLKIKYAIVSEAGASVYSASKLAAEEFPQYDVSLRSAVSIARRLQDPLAELVKIDPKAIGVGQYQHDMPKARLDDALSGVVESSVNSVGVFLNTASFSLLSYVAGIGPALAKNIVAHRDENGEFTTRQMLLKVPKLGKKAFEQAAGFLRVPESKNPLDNTAVHPESYKAALALLEICGYTKNDIGTPNLHGLKAKIGSLGSEKIAAELGLGVPTLLDIADELVRPGRDPRDELPPVQLRSDLLDIADLKEGMALEGTVRNVTDFGAFVDIGVHQDGLVHISEISNKYIKHPSQAVAVGDIVNVVVLSVDPAKKRISLSMKKAAN